MKSHRAFPPGMGNLKIPVSSRRAARAGLALYGPCRPKGRFARWVAWRLVDLFGASALPGRSIEWHPPMTHETWKALTSVWHDRVGPFDDVAIFDRAQASRTGFAALLLRNGGAVGFAKVREGDGSALANEARALQAIGGSGPTLFEVPTAIALGTVERWHFFLVSPLHPSLHTMPVRPPLGEIVFEIQSGLSGLQRPSGTASHWRPMHGDFTPWNLRQRPDGSLFLIDWEDAAWAPPGADEVYYRAVESALGGRRFDSQDFDEAIQFWRGDLEKRRIGATAAGDRDRGLLDDLLQALGG